MEVKADKASFNRVFQMLLAYGFSSIRVEREGAFFVMWCEI